MADYENFVRAQLPRLLRYATMLTGERELAANLVQDVLVKVYRRWSRISEMDHSDRYCAPGSSRSASNWATSAVHG
jgi:DNA-directed RNA polymerase specialized sigma24 family protein